MNRSILKMTLIFCLSIFTINFSYADPLSTPQTEKYYIVRITSKNPTIPINFKGTGISMGNQGSALGNTYSAVTPYEYQITTNFLGVIVQASSGNQEIKVEIFDKVDGENHLVSSSAGHVVMAYNDGPNAFITAK